MLSYNLWVEVVTPSNYAGYVNYVTQESKLAYPKYLFLRNIVNTESEAGPFTAGGTEDESGTR